MEIRHKIKKLIEEKDISTLALAKGLGKSRQNVYDILNGKVSLNVEHLERFCEVLGVEPYTLFISKAAPPQSKEELKNVISSVMSVIIKKNYIDVASIKTLALNLIQNAYEGRGLVNIELIEDKQAGKYIIKEVYKPLKSKLSDSELKDFAKTVFGNVFRSIKEQLDVYSYEKVIDDYLDRYYANQSK